MRVQYTVVHNVHHRVCYATNLGSRLVGTEASICVERESGHPSDPTLVQHQRPLDRGNVQPSNFLYDPVTRGSRSPRFITVPPNVRASKDLLDLLSVDYSSRALRLSELDYCIIGIPYTDSVLRGI